MSSKKDPAVLFYTSDFLAGTMLMDYEQKGKYITLLCLQHQRGRLSEKEMMTICGCYDEDIFGKFEQDENGRYFNKRMEEESEKRRKFTESRRSNRTKTEGCNTCVYLIFDPKTGNTKVGKSNNPERRLIELKHQTKNDELYIIAYVSDVPQTLESEIHELYRDKRVVNEWYALTDKDITTIISTYHMICDMTLHKIPLMGNGNGNENRNENIGIVSSKGNKRVSKGNKRVFVPPTYEEVLEYAKTKGHEDLAHRFFEYYNDGDWVDSQGNNVRNWKQKFLTWCAGEEKKPVATKPAKEKIRYGNFDPEEAWKRSLEEGDAYVRMVLEELGEL